MQVMRFLKSENNSHSKMAGQLEWNKEFNKLSADQAYDYRVDLVILVACP